MYLGTTNQLLANKQISKLVKVLT